MPKKRPGDYRLVVDYRALNDATVADAHPLPRIEDILQRQGKFQIWTVLDLKDGFHQIPIRDDCKHFTCMSTPVGVYQWKVLPMCLALGRDTALHCTALSLYCAALPRPGAK